MKPGDSMIDPAHPRTSPAAPFRGGMSARADGESRVVCVLRIVSLTLGGAVPRMRPLTSRPPDSPLAPRLTDGTSTASHALCPVPPVGSRARLWSLS